MIPRHVLASIPQRRDSRILESLGMNDLADDLIINPASGGFSRNTVFHARVGSGESLIQYAIRSWESATYDADRILQILAFQTHLTEKQIAAPKPIRWLNNQWIIPYERTFWTIESWLAGQSLASGSDVSDQLLSKIVESLFDLHTAGRTFGTIQQPSQGIADRIHKISEWKERISIAKVEKLVREVSSLGTLANVSSEQLSRIQLGFGIALQAIQQLGNYWIRECIRFQNHKPDCHWINRDLWRNNILVDQDRITGIVDFGASRIDWPILELVRCLSSFLDPHDSRWQSALNHYQEVPLSHKLPVELENICMLDHVATTLSLFYWYDWLTLKDLESIDRQKPAIWTRVEELAIRMTSHYRKHSNDNRSIK